VLRWLRSTLRGEQSAAGLEARRRAGGIAYALVEEADELESRDRGAQLFRLCAWNAYAFQTIVDVLMDSDARTDPATAGYVPRSTLRFAGPCVDQVPEWIRYARMVESDPDLHLADRLPASLPEWHHDEPTTSGELVGLRTAYEALQPRVESSLQALAASGAADPHVLAQMRGMLAEMTSAAEYAVALLRPGLGPVDRGEVRWRLLDALRQAVDLGQVLAMPSLLDVVQFRRHRTGGVPLSAELSWLEVEPGWLVFDRERRKVGSVARVHGDRATGELESIEVMTPPDRPELVVPAHEIASIETGEIVLR
jgi:hypothetical protein